MANLTLYSFHASSAAYRVRIALNFKALDYTYRAVDLLKAEQHEASYLEFNPAGEVPTLVTADGTRLGQSMAIFLWLDKSFPSRPLFPVEPNAMAAVAQFCENINSGIHPIQNLKVRQELERRFRQSEAQRGEWCAYWIDRGFVALEKTLAKTAGKYCFGDVVTAADMFLVPQVVNARRFKVDLAKFPNIVRVDRAACELDVFKRAHPSVQPDFPKS
jgi:maleylacetoacetate isomerase